MTERTPDVLPNELPDDAITQRDTGGKDASAWMAHVRHRYDVHVAYWSRIHEEAREDDLLIAGDHWPQAIRNEREEDGRPVLTYNTLPSFVRQITNRMREQRPQVKIRPVEATRGGDTRVPNIAGTRDYSMADVYSGIVRNIEHVSRADQAYDTAGKHAADHGFGFFTLINVWSKVDPFVQDLVIQRVKDSYCVMLDPDAIEADMRDAQDAFVISKMKRQTFEKKWPDAAVSELEPSNSSIYPRWYDSDNITVAQYFWIDYVDDESIKLSNGKVVYASEAGPVLDELKQETGIYVAKDEKGEELRKKVKRPVCKWQRITGQQVLEEVELPFSAIPIFPVFGEELVIDGETRYESAIRHARDAQRSYNYWRTAAAETVALSPRAPYMLTPKQIAGHEHLYEQANKKNLPYLLYNPQDGVDAPKRQYADSVAAAELANANQDAQDIQTIIGLHDASLGADGNEKSGKAILARQAQGSTSTFQFPDNLARAMQQMARLIVEAAPRIYDTQRVLRLRMPDGSDDFVEINSTIVDGQTGKTFRVHDIAFGRYDVVMEVGPSYATQRQEAAELQMKLLEVLGPDMARNIVHLIVKNLGVPGSEEVAGVLRKMLPDALKSEDEKNADLPRGVTKDDKTGQLMKDGQPWQPPPTPEQVAMQRQQAIEDAKVKAEQAKADAAIATADSDKQIAAARVREAQLKLQALEREQAAAGSEQGDNNKLMAQIEAVIKQALEAHGMDEGAHKGATETMIANAIVDALTRVKGFVDKRIKTALAEAEAQRDDEAGESGGTESEGAGAGRPSKTSAAPSSPVHIQIGDAKKPSRVNFEYDEDGNVAAAVPQFEDAANDQPRATA